MRVKQLILVRHGEYGDDDKLNADGRDQISALAGKLEPFIEEKTLLILTSPAERARESAEILARFFGVGFEEHEILWSDDYNHLPDDAEVLKLTRSRRDEADTIILVTHYEYVGGFPVYFTAEEWGASISSWAVHKGEAWVLDCLQKTLTHVSP